MQILPIIEDNLFDYLTRFANIHIYFHLRTGVAFCGCVGSSYRQEYAVVGDIVNLSARLMVAAKLDSTLTDQNTYELAVEKFDFVAHTPIKVKGIINDSLLSTCSP